MPNLLLQEPDYVFSENKWGTTRKYLYEGGMLFREFKSHTKIGHLPLIHITYGKNPETGKRIWANGFIAIGRKAIGPIAIGQVSVGIIAIGQLSIGLLAAVGQAAIASTFSLGQLAIGYAAIGQLAIGYYALGQIAKGAFVFSVK